ncbi:vacuolar segregation protein PEP7 [Biomphalaria glabrata]|uniref:Uncharacterized protein LOC106070531 n=2 Tax=Biomphalaria glabrata TaxID=6526 RepID=A0A9W2Z2V6_BIOGL|nr:uncharacterized protein LOC106070531 [Biomphalaria glabrata]KAI8751027.1 vacuolar segregation protein PEP7-like [Biomphalaria glabrata]
MDSVKHPTNAEAEQHLSGVYQEIDNLTSNKYQHEYVGYLKDISKRHWKPIENRACCFNTDCRKQFSALLERPKHCRSCGEVYCDNCVKYKRRLSKLAQPDPNGDFYKVCKSCFDQGKLNDGQTTNHTTEFIEFRKHAKRSAYVISRRNFHLNKECERLIRGFKESIGNSGINFKLHEMKSLITTPDWMKSSLWLRENMAASCHICKQRFSLFTTKDFCRLCGASVCKLCSTKDLLLYLNDEDKDNEHCQPQLAIIKIIGCPNKEPEVCLYLKVCLPCKDKMIQKQVEALEEEDSVMVGSNFMENLNKIDLKLRKEEEQVKSELPKYTAIVESLEDKTRKSEYQNNMKILAKAQANLADVLAHHVTTVQQLKKLKPVTDTQSSVLKKYILAKCDFYMNSMSTFRSLKHKLSEVVSPESLQLIQLSIEKDAIISTQVYVRQLIYETLHICQKYKLEETIPKMLIKVEESIESDLNTYFTAVQEDVNKHMELLKVILQERITKNKLIKVSNSRFKSYGTRYIHNLMYSKVENVLNQILNQLQLVSVLRSLSASKKALEDALTSLQNAPPEVDETDYVIVGK